MNREQAYTLIQQTFTHAFDQVRFQNFIRNLLNYLDESNAESKNSQVKDAFKEHVQCYQRLGTYTSPDKETLDVLIVYLTSESKLERARTAIRNFVADHLKTRDEKDAALVAFVSPTETTWRFSYIKMEYAGVVNDAGKVGVEIHLTPARRFSYIVGEGESCHTAQTRFLDLLQYTQADPTLASIEEAFSVEAVTKEFFIEYAKRFVKIHETLDDIITQNKALEEEFTDKGVNTVDFAKKLMGQIVFLYFLQKKGWLGISTGEVWGNGPRDFLRRMIKGEYGAYENFFDDILEPLFYDTLATDRGHVAWCNRFNCRIPFLNGGLFEPLGNYDWRNTRINLPNRLFTNTEFVEEGITGTGVLDVFDRYNFTVNEAEPLEKEVAIDPEMLGKVFENLIEDNRRKGLGAFYTPREIVHYMCQESLINYLDTSLNISHKPLASVAVQQSKLFADPEPGRAALTVAVYEVIVPRTDIETFVHLGEQISHYEAVDMPKSIVLHARLLDEKLADITICDPAVGSGAFPVGMMTVIVRARCTLTPYLNDMHERTPYYFKRHAIQNNLYGVDIDAGAVEIAKLRLWLSLVVDEVDVKQIKPLPNLDFKILPGNSLMSFPFKSQRLRKVEALKAIFFEETDHNRKATLKHDIENILRECFVILSKNLGYQISFDFEISFSEVFHQKEGFDIIIANPPYGAEFSETESELYKYIFGTYAYRAESYVFFIEKGIKLLRTGGVLSYITPDTYLNLAFTQKLRSFLLKNTKLNEIFLLPASVFEAATVDTALLLVEKTTVQQSFYPTSVRVRLLNKQSRLESLSKVDHQFFAHTADWYNSQSFNIAAEPHELATLTHMEATSLQVSDIAVIFSGIKVYEEGKGKPSQTRSIVEQKPFTAKTQCDRSFLPFYDGKHIGRYTDLWQHNNWVKYGPWLAAPRNPKNYVGEKILIRKIVGDKLIATYIPDTSYCNTLLFVLKLSGVSNFTYKTLLGILNSRLIGWYYRKKFQICDQDTFPQIMIRDILQFPLPVISENCTYIDNLVDQILIAKRRDSRADTSALECEIDHLIYKFYDLSSEEIALVEQ